jgi:hypothetical protein
MSSHWDDHSDHPVADWQYEVANGDTRQSYAEWCASQVEQARETARDSWPRYRVGIQREEARTHVFEVRASDAGSAMEAAMELAYDFDFADAEAGDPSYSVAGILHVDEAYGGGETTSDGMKVKVYEAAVDTGYGFRAFRSPRHADVVREVAALCRAAWDERSWLPVPPIPDSDEEVISVYFHQFPDVEGPTIVWDDYEIEI